MGRSGNTDNLSKVPDSVIREMTTDTQPFRFSLRVPEAFVPELNEATFVCIAHA